MTNENRSKIGQVLWHDLTVIGTEVSAAVRHWAARLLMVQDRWATAGLV
jgi:hypothetical protein